MCKLMEDMRNEAATEAAILASIEAWRDVKVSEEEIKSKIMDKYNLTEEQAKDYMLEKSA